MNNQSCDQRTRNEHFPMREVIANRVIALFRSKLEGFKGDYRSLSNKVSHISSNRWYRQCNRWKGASWRISSRSGSSSRSKCPNIGIRRPWDRVLGFWVRVLGGKSEISERSWRYTKAVLGAPYFLDKNEEGEEMDDVASEAEDVHHGWKYLFFNFFFFFYLERSNLYHKPFSDQNTCSVIVRFQWLNNSFLWILVISCFFISHDILSGLSPQECINQRNDFHGQAKIFQKKRKRSDQASI